MLDNPLLISSSLAVIENFAYSQHKCVAKGDVPRTQLSSTKLYPVCCNYNRCSSFALGGAPYIEAIKYEVLPML